MKFCTMRKFSLCSYVCSINSIREILFHAKISRYMVYICAYLSLCDDMHVIQHASSSCILYSMH